ncbi:MAG: hypothetical protein PHI34_03900 [Acidobacteriota bacterium]|nr:hypothetical protein [Acidobacteriota bacterium]
MRNENERSLDDDAARLIRAALPAEARLDPRLKQDLRLRLAGELRVRRADDFPRAALILLAGAAGLLGLRALYDLVVLGASLADLPAHLAAALALNLAAVPPAFFIRNRERRKSHA